MVTPPRSGLVLRLWLAVDVRSRVVGMTIGLWGSGRSCYGGGVLPPLHSRYRAMMCVGQRDRDGAMRPISVRWLIAAAGLTAVLLFVLRGFWLPPIVPPGAPTWRGLPVYPNGEIMGDGSLVHTPDDQAQIRTWLDRTWSYRGEFVYYGPTTGALDNIGFYYNVSYWGVGYYYHGFEDIGGGYTISIQMGRWVPFDCKRC